MADHSQAPPSDLHTVRSLGGVCRICRSFIRKCYSERNASPHKTQRKNKPISIEEEHKAHEYKNCSQVTMNSEREGSPRGISKLGSHNKGYFTCSPLSSPPLSRSTSPASHSRSTSPSPLSRSTSKRSVTPIRSAAANLLKSMSRRRSAEAAILPSSLSRSSSRRSSTAIMYSNSNGLIKPPPMGMILECTLEELCFGCIKKIKITRDSVTDYGYQEVEQMDRYMISRNRKAYGTEIGTPLQQIIKEDELLTIKVKPGWRRGTKITFEGMGNETPGADPADVIFTILEKKHPTYRREGDDLELAVEVPLVKALTGCIIPIPLLGGEKMILTIDDIIYPGYQKIIAGQGMPKPHEQGKRGNLIITLLVEFPTELTEEQRSDIVRLLQDSY